MNKPVNIKLLNLSITVFPKVFIPKYVTSTYLIINFLKGVRFKQKTKVLEIGSGSGIISIYLASLGCKVAAYDINKIAILNTLYNVKQNNLEENVEVLKHKPYVKYPLIIINPPYLPCDPSDDLDINWCCGNDLRILKQILRDAKRSIVKGGLLILTISSLTNYVKVKHILTSLGFTIIFKLTKPSLFDKVYLLLCKYNG